MGNYTVIGGGESPDSLVYPDPESPYVFETGELVAMVVANVVLVLDVLLVVVAMVRARTFRPLKARQLPLALGAAIAGFFWCNGTALANRIYPTTAGMPVAVCPIVILWFQICFGLQGVATLYFIRLWRLFMIFFLPNKVRSKRHYYGPMALFYLPTLLFGILATALGWVNFVEWPLDSGRFLCYSYNSFVYGSLILVLIDLVVLTWTSIMLRKINVDNLSELRIVVVSMTASLLVYTGAIVIILLYYTNDLWGRILNVYLYLLAIQVAILSQIGSALYHSFVNPAEAEAKFLHQLRSNPTSTTSSHGSVAPTTLLPSPGEKQVPQVLA